MLIGTLVLKMTVDAAELRTGINTATAVLSKFACTVTVFASKIASVLTSPFRLVTSLLGKLYRAVFSFRTLLMATGATLFWKFLTGAAEVLETQTVRFAGLLGSIEKAQVRVKRLTRMAAETPFKLPDIVKANILLEILTQGALSTAEGMKLVGDSAAMTMRKVSEVAFWVGRLYNNIMTGRAAGRPAMRLQQMGLLTGALRNELDEWAKSSVAGGVANERMWQKVTRELQRAKGQMDNLFQTVAGLKTTVLDMFDEVRRQLGKPIIPAYRQALFILWKDLDKLSKHPILGILGEKVGRGFFGTFMALREGLKILLDPMERSKLFGMLIEDLKNLPTNVGNLFVAIVEDMSIIFGTLIKNLVWFIDVFKAVFEYGVKLFHSSWQASIRGLTQSLSEWFTWNFRESSPEAWDIATRRTDTVNALRDFLAAQDPDKFGILPGVVRKQPDARVFKERRSLAFPFGRWMTDATQVLNRLHDVIMLMSGASTGPEFIRKGQDFLTARGSNLRLDPTPQSPTTFAALMTAMKPMLLDIAKVSNTKDAIMKMGLTTGIGWFVRHLWNVGSEAAAGIDLEFLSRRLEIAQLMEAASNESPLPIGLRKYPAAEAKGSLEALKTKYQQFEDTELQSIAENTKQAAIELMAINLMIDQMARWGEKVRAGEKREGEIKSFSPR